SREGARKWPVNREHPDALRQVKYWGRDSDDVKRQHRVAGHGRVHDCVGLVRVMRHGLAHGIEVEDLNPETLGRHVNGYVDDEDQPRHALQRVHPVANVRILEWIRLPLPRDPQAVNPMKKQRQKDKQRLDAQQVRKALKRGDRLVEGLGAERGIRVGVKMFEQKGADGQKACELVKLLQNELTL